MFELEFIPTNKKEDSTFTLNEEPKLTQSLLDFIENEWENIIGDFKLIKVYNLEGNLINTINI